MNIAILCGNVTKDPEIYTTQGGVKRANFTLAITRRFANAQGNREADFLPIVAWRQLADFVEKYVKKGKKLGVVGTVQTRSYDAQDGSKRYVTEIVADSIEFLSPKEQEAAPAAAQAPTEVPPEVIQARALAIQEQLQEEYSDDLTF